MSRKRELADNAAVEIVVYWEAYEIADSGFGIVVTVAAVEVMSKMIVLDVEEVAEVGRTRFDVDADTEAGIA